MSFIQTKSETTGTRCLTQNAFIAMNTQVLIMILDVKVPFITALLEVKK